ncbi:hypothetical protein FIBSPDRAFT_1050452 [Athelia psychrophila]|uniref:Uncharacterized protein n=1 Tax=Athelia psychrophila TaxID=1759441 RepID=A0A166AT34_9AGAM|nr:hypothetical protein FIBSPDRAFT_1050452 [Fibularhizoctonia sp. CBS 109695]
MQTEKHNNTPFQILADDMTPILSDMGQAATDFSKGMQAAMIALYSIQAALIAYYSTRNSKGLIESFQNTRNGLRADWEKYTIFFKGCQAYSEDYVALCQYSVTHRSSETLAFASDVLDMAKDLSRETRILQFNNSRACAALETDIQRLPSDLRRKPSPTVVVNFNVEMNNDKLTDFIQHVNSPTTYDGVEAVRELNAALTTVRTSFHNLDLFWTRQVALLVDASSPKSTFTVTAPDLKSISETWSRYRVALQSIVATFSTSSDAVKVDPINEFVKDQRPPRSLWSRFKHALCM